MFTDSSGKSPTKSEMKNVGKILLTIIIAGSSVLISCSPRLNYSVLNFLFDGVPEPEGSRNIKSIDSLSIVSAAKTETKPLPDESVYFFHQPYMANECKACHERGNLGNIITREDRLCYYCHDSFSDIYNNIHGPADSGQCMICHDPHMSKIKNMLKRPERNLCTYCHPGDQLTEKSHCKTEENNCLSCHNPHGGGKYYLH